jgi:hypothetical protein
MENHPATDDSNGPYLLAPFKELPRMDSSGAPSPPAEDSIVIETVRYDYEA